MLVLVLPQGTDVCSDVFTDGVQVALAAALTSSTSMPYNKSNVSVSVVGCPVGESRRLASVASLHTSVILTYSYKLKIAGIANHRATERLVSVIQQDADKTATTSTLPSSGPFISVFGATLATTLGLTVSTVRLQVPNANVDYPV